MAGQDYSAIADTGKIGKDYVLYDTNTLITSNIRYLGVLNINDTFRVITNFKLIPMALTVRGNSSLIFLDKNGDKIEFQVGFEEELPEMILNNQLVFKIKDRMVAKNDYPEFPNLFCLPEEQGCFERQ